MLEADLPYHRSRTLHLGWHAMWEILDAVWYVLENPAQPGECVVLDSLWRKLSPLWLSEAEARAFLEALPAASGMRVT
ncbi:DUF3234 domain-containing protein, partial [Escherichia coli]|nr:DUF3234 domain-containing protein [Escherichia coli]